MKKAMLKKILAGTTAAALCLAMLPAADMVAVYGEDEGVLTMQEEVQAENQEESGEVAEGTEGLDLETEESGEEEGTKSMDEAQPMPTVMPVIQNVSRTTITVKGVTGIEYSIDGGKTVKVPDATSKLVAFTGLKPGTRYTITNRTAAADGKTASDWTAGTTVTTLIQVSRPAVKNTRSGGKLNYSQVKATRGTTFELKLVGVTKKGKIKLKKKDKKILSVTKTGKNKWKVTLKAPGTVYLKVKAGKKYKCTVTALPYRIGKNDNKFFAHRGLANSYPENSRIALTKSMQAGFYGTNFDLWPSKPDSKGKYEFIVSHDNELKKMTSGKGNISGTLASSILKMKVTKGNNAKKYKQNMIRLEDAIAITDKYKGYGQIEMKNKLGTPWTMKQTNELARRLKSLKHPERYQIEAMDPYTLRNFRDSQKKYGLDLDLNLVCGEMTGDTKRDAQLCQTMQFDNMPTYYGKISKAVVQDCRKKGIGIAGYAHINEDSNLMAKKMEPLDLDYLVVPSVPWA